MAVVEEGLTLQQWSLRIPPMPSLSDDASSPPRTSGSPAVRHAVPGWSLPLLVVFMFLGGCYLRAAPLHPDPPIACGGRFEATVRQGPSAGLSLVGNLVLRVESSGRARAVLTLRDRSEIHATGQVNGQAINLIFVVSPDTYIFGVGTMQQAVPECGGVWGGPFVGPELGDIGDWFGTNMTPRS